MFAGGTAQTLATTSGATVIFGQSTINSVSLNSQGGSLTLGPGVLVRGQNGYVGFDPNFGGSGTFLNQGTIVADSAGNRIQVQNISNFSSGTLSGGVWKAQNGGTLRLIGASITSDAANIVLDGSTSRILSDTGNTNALAGLATITAGGVLTLSHLGTQSPASLTTSGNVNNDGTLTIDPLSRLTVTGTYTQGSSGVLNVQIGGGPLAGSTYVNATGNATLAGTLNVSYINNFTPANGATYTVVNSNALSGTFATVTGLASGMTAVYEPDDVAGDAADGHAARPRRSFPLTAGGLFNVSVQITGQRRQRVRTSPARHPLRLPNVSGRAQRHMTATISNGVAGFISLSINNAAAAAIVASTAGCQRTSNAFTVQPTAFRHRQLDRQRRRRLGCRRRWDTGFVPNSATDVIINAAPVSCTAIFRRDTVHGITSSKPLTISGGSLTVTTTISSTSIDHFGRALQEPLTRALP